MKKIYALIMLLTVSNVTTIHTNYITNKAVTHKSQLIKQMITRHNYMAAGLSALGYIQQLSYWMPVIVAGFERLSGEQVPLQQLCAACVLKGQSADNKIGFFASIARDTKELFGTADGWGRIAKGGLTAGGYIGSFFVMQKIADTICHPDTLSWYISANVPYKNTIKIMQGLAEKLESKETINEKQRKHYSFVLHTSCKQLVGYGQDICGYMMYKSEELPEVQKMLAEKTARYLMNYQNDIFAQLFALLGQNEINYNALNALLQKYAAELKYQVKIFASIEGETEKNMSLT